MTHLSEVRLALVLHIWKFIVTSSRKVEKAAGCDGEQVFSYASFNLCLNKTQGDWRKRYQLNISFDFSITVDDIFQFKVMTFSFSPIWEIKTWPENLNSLLWKMFNMKEATECKMSECLKRLQFRILKGKIS